MIRVLLRPFVLVSLCALPCLGSAEALPPVPASTATTSSTPPAPIVDGTGNAIDALLHDMQRGDEPAASKVYQTATDPIVHVWAAMVVERIRFDLDAASKDAQICEDALIASKPLIALRCGQFQSGDLRMAGRFKEANAKESELAERYRGRGVDSQLAAMRAREALLADGPPPVVEPPEQDLRLPFKTPEEGGSRSTVVAEANGQSMDLLLDTGASVLDMGQEEARRYGVKMLNQGGHTSGMLSKDIPTQHGILDTLKIDSLTLRNLPVEVLPGSHRPLLGLDILAPMGTLRFTQSALYVYGSHSTPPACEQSIAAGSDLDGWNLRLHPMLLIENRPTQVVLDTGAGMYLAGSKAALAVVTALHRGKFGAGDLGGRHAFTNVQASKVNLVIAGQPFQMYFPVYTDSSISWPFLLGFGALRDMDFLLDFRHQRMCFLLHPNLH